MKTAISIKLRAIPLSAGLSRVRHKVVHKFATSHHVQPSYRLSVEPDRDLEAEIKRHKEVGL